MSPAILRPAAPPASSLHPSLAPLVHALPCASRAPCPATTGGCCGTPRLRWPSATTSARHLRGDVPIPLGTPVGKRGRRGSGESPAPLGCHIFDSAHRGQGGKGKRGEWGEGAKVGLGLDDTNAPHSCNQTVSQPDGSPTRGSLNQTVLGSGDPDARFPDPARQALAAVAAAVIALAPVPAVALGAPALLGLLFEPIAQAATIAESEPLAGPLVASVAGEALGVGGDEAGVTSAASAAAAGGDGKEAGVQEAVGESESRALEGAAAGAGEERSEQEEREQQLKVLAQQKAQYDQRRLLQQNRRIQTLNGVPDAFPAFIREGFNVTVLTGPEYVRLPSGLILWDIVEGNGDLPTDGQEVKFHYIGYNESGRRIDSTYLQGRPAQTRLGINAMIPGFEEGIKTMRPGGVRRMIIPPELGPPTGPSTFFSAKQYEVFDVELLTIKDCQRRQILFYSDVICE